MGSQSRSILGAASIVVFRTIRISHRQRRGNRMHKKKDGKCRKRAKGHPLLGAFTTYELKEELRRRRREGGLIRQILWRMGRWT